MPELRLQKARESLPADYRFGDMGPYRLRAEAVGTTGIAVRFVRSYTILTPLAALNALPLHDSETSSRCR